MNDAVEFSQNHQPKTLAEANQVISLLQESLRLQQKNIHIIEQQYESLQHQLSNLLRGKFGKSSEKLPDGVVQLSLLDNDKSYTLVLANISIHLGWTNFYHTNNVEQSEKYFKKGLAIYESKIPNVSARMDKLLAHLRWDQTLKSNDGIKCDYGFALDYYGMTKHDMADHKTAKHYYEKALKIFDDLKNIDSVLFYKVHLLLDLGWLYGCYDKDYLKFEQALSLIEKIVNKYFPGHPTLILFKDEFMACLLFLLDRHDQAKERVENSLRVGLSMYSEQHTMIASLRSLLGTLLCFTHRIDEGLASFKQAEMVYESNKKISQIGVVLPRFYIRVSEAYEMNKEYDKALQYLMKAQKLVKEARGANKNTVISNYFQPVVELSFLEKSEKNIDYYLQALDLTKKLFGKNHTRVARYYYLIGQVFANIDNKMMARKFYQKALTIANDQKFKDRFLIEKNQKNIQIIRDCLRKIGN